MSMELDLEIMRATGQQALGIADQMKVTLGQVDGTVGGVAGAWRGSSHTAFVSVMERFDTAMAKTQLALQEISDTIGRNQVNYGVAEDDVSATVSAAGGAVLNLG